MFLSAAEALSEIVSEKDLAVGRMYPPLEKIKDCSVVIATRVAEQAYRDKTASTYPEPEDKMSFVKSQLYNYEYDDISALPARYEWPKEVQQKYQCNL